MTWHLDDYRCTLLRGILRHSFQEKSPRNTAENIVKHRSGGVGSVVANHRGGGETSMVVTTLQFILLGNRGTCVNCEQLAEGCYLKAHQPGVDYDPVNRESNVLTITPPGCMHDMCYSPVCLSRVGVLWK